MTIEQVIANALQISEDTIRDGVTRENIEEWDSMGHLTLITALESEYQIQISIADAMEMNSVTRIKEMLHKYGAGGL